MGGRDVDGVVVGLDFCMRTAGLCDCDVARCIKIVDCGRKEAKIDNALTYGFPVVVYSSRSEDSEGLGNVQWRVGRVEYGVCVRGLGNRNRKRYGLGRVANVYASRIFECPDQG
jgi:hypothetical protein